MRDYPPDFYGIVHVTTEALVSANGVPLLFSSRMNAELFIKKMKLDPRHMPIHLVLTGRSPIEGLMDGWDCNGKPAPDREHVTRHNFPKKGI
jgi:hypothetical protein